MKLPYSGRRESLRKNVLEHLKRHAATRFYYGLGHVVEGAWSRGSGV